MTFGLKIILSLPLSLKRKYVSKQDSKGSSGNKVCPSAFCCENKMDSVTRVPGIEELRVAPAGTERVRKFGGWEKTLLRTLCA